MTSQLRWQYETSNTGDHIITIKLWPYRSLSLQGFKIVMTALSLAIFSLGLGFYLLGAWPVIGFLGAEIGLVWFAFRFNYRAGQLIEEITISPISVIITRTDWRGRHTKQILDSAWIKAELVPKKRAAVNYFYGIIQNYWKLAHFCRQPKNHPLHQH